MGDTSRKRSTCSSEIEGEVTEEGRGEQFVETNRGHQKINLDSITRTNVEESSSNVEEKPNGNNLNNNCVIGIESYLGKTSFFRRKCFYKPSCH